MAKFVYQHNQEKVIREIILTEAAYVRDLKLLITLYVEPIRTKELLSTEEISDMFSNVEMLFVINNTLLQKLLQAQQTGNNPVKEFLALKEYLKLYSVYCANQAKSMVTLKECRKRQPFADFLQEVHKAPQCHKQDINSFLIKPIQRLCKYPLLIRELIKCTTPDDAQYQTLQEALFELQKLVQAVEEQQFGKSSLSVQKDLEKAWDVRKKVDFTDSPISIVQAGRSLIGEYGPMTLTQEDKKEDLLTETMIFLFTDMLLWANAQAFTPEKKMKMIGHLILSSAQVHVYDSSDKYFIELRGENEEVPKSVKFANESKEKRDSFIFDVRRVMDVMKEKSLAQNSPRPDLVTSQDSIPKATEPTLTATTPIPTPLPTPTITPTPTPTPTNHTTPTEAESTLKLELPLEKSPNQNACTVPPLPLGDQTTTALSLLKTSSPSISPSVSPKQTLKTSPRAYFNKMIELSPHSTAPPPLSSPPVSDTVVTVTLDNSSDFVTPQRSQNLPFRSGSARELRKRWEETKSSTVHSPVPSHRSKAEGQPPITPSSSSPPLQSTLAPPRRKLTTSNTNVGPHFSREDDFGFDNESLRRELMLQKQQIWKLTSLLTDLDLRLQTVEKDNKKLKMENVKLTNQMQVLTCNKAEESKEPPL